MAYWVVRVDPRFMEKFEPDYLDQLKKMRRRVKILIGTVFLLEAFILSMAVFDWEMYHATQRPYYAVYFLIQLALFLFNLRSLQRQFGILEEINEDIQVLVDNK